MYKCTFIILSRDIYDETGGNKIASMIGDTNLFLQKPDSNRPTEHCAEVEIMIAEKLQRGKGLGWEAVCLMMSYGIRELNVKQFEAKIKLDNSPSIKMFQKLGFSEVSRSEVFREITFSLRGPEVSEFEKKFSAIILNGNTVKYQHQQN